MNRLFDDVNDIGELNERYLIELASVPEPPGVTRTRAHDRYEETIAKINRQYDEAMRRIRNAV